MSPPSPGNGRPPGFGLPVRIDRFPRFDIDPSELEGLIGQYGTDGELRRAVPCPCTSAESSIPEPLCTVCRGQGFAYPQSQRGTLRVLESGRNPRTTRLAPGEETSGTLQVTVCGSVVLARGDLWLPECEPHVVTQRLYRVVSQDPPDAVVQDIRQQDWLGRPMEAVGRPMVERLVYPDVFRVEAAVWKRADGTLGEAATPDDFTLVDGVVTWREGGNQPHRGATYSVRYLAKVAYMVESSMPVFRRVGGIALPWRVTLSRLDKVQRADVV